MRFRARGARRALVASALLALTALTVVAGGSAARSPEASGTEGIIDAQWTPGSLRDAKTTVVVELAGKPVTVVEADAERSLSPDEKKAVKDQLKGKQDALAGANPGPAGRCSPTTSSPTTASRCASRAAKVGRPGGAAGRRRRARPPDDEAGQRPRRAADRRSGGLGRPRGLHGEGMKIAVIDTGIDYTHANFGGPGTVAAYQAANAADTLPAEPGAVRPGGPRVKGGTDLVGDSYDADPDAPTCQPIPHPDPNPLDCNGHGSHVAGTAAGSGVLANGTTYTGPYNATTISGT